MKKFNKKLLAFLVLPFSLILADLLSAPNAFTIRQWEALQFSYPFFTYGAFYPGWDITMDEMGDLGRHTNYEIPKHTNWKTDALGFRNGEYISNPDILFIGDSFFTGASLTQDDMINMVLQKKMDSIYMPGKYSTYNISPNTFEGFDLLLQTKHLQKPKLVVFSVIERSVNSLKSFAPSEKLGLGSRIMETVINVIPSYVPVCIDRLIKFNFLRYLSAKVNPIELVNRFKTAGPSKVSAGTHPKMLFYENEPVKANADTIASSAIESLLFYKKYCNKIGAQLIFVPIPDKESVYGLKSQSNHSSLNQLDTLLKKNDIKTVNVFQLYNLSKINEPDKLLYQYDDTHWNANGVKLVANELVKHIEEIFPVNK